MTTLHIGVAVFQYVGAESQSCNLEKDWNLKILANIFKGVPSKRLQHFDVKIFSHWSRNKPRLPFSQVQNDVMLLLCDAAICENKEQRPRPGDVRAHKVFLPAKAHPAENGKNARAVFQQNVSSVTTDGSTRITLTWFHALHNCDFHKFPFRFIFRFGRVH